jgi:hypothetical protein
MAQRYNYLSFNLGVLHKVVVTGFEASHALRGSGCRMEYALTSPDNRHLALCTEIRTLLGLLDRRRNHRRSLGARQNALPA